MLRSFLPGKSATPVIIRSQVKQLAFYAVQSAAHLSPVRSALLRLVPAVHALPSGLAAHQHAMLILPLQSEAAVTAHHVPSEAQHAQRAGVQLLLCMLCQLSFGTCQLSKSSDSACMHDKLD